MPKISLKSKTEIEIMRVGGNKLAIIRKKIADAVKPGVSTEDLEKIAIDLINKSGGEASFKMVPGYHHATCININDEVVHGIPGKTILKAGDIVGIDVGLYYKGFHTDAAVTVPVGTGKDSEFFLSAGKSAIKKAISVAKPGKKISDISRAMQQTIEKAGFSVVRALTGHGVGKHLHEEPTIPCFETNDEHPIVIKEGMVLAIEVMYNQGTYEVVYKNNDGWTIATADGKISGLFEESVAITGNGPEILTVT